MRTHLFARTAGLGLLVAGLVLGLRPAPADTPRAAPEKSSTLPVGSYTISGPYACENLTVFLIHGKDQLQGKTYLTLQEALDQKKVVVHETKTVNQLAIENLSPDAEIFVQSGEIVKGGQQDRAIAFDLILPPKSGKVPIAAFCVEAGRWTRRGNESVARFDASPNALPSKEGKLAVKRVTVTKAEVVQPASQGARRTVTVTRYTTTAQSAVWREVARKQMMLARALGKSVQSDKSKTSLQLTLEDKKLLDVVDAYTKKLRPLLEGKKDVIGYAFAINGQINSADIYASHALFVKLWPKLLAATVVEAISEKQKDKKFEPAKMEAVKVLILDAEKGKSANKEVTARVRLVTQETEKNVLFTTEDQKNKGIAVHKNYIKK